MTDYSLFFSDIRNTGYQDWSTVADTDYTSFVMPWYGLTDDTALWMEAPWVVTYMMKDTNASCLMTPYWDWTASTTVHKTGPTSQCFIDRPGILSDRRHRVRGKGRALQLRFESESGKPFNLIGWSVLLDRNADY